MSAALASFHADFTPFGSRSLLTLFVSAQAVHRARGLGRAMLTPTDVAGLAGCRVAAALRALRRASALLGDGPRSVRLVMSRSVVVIEARVSDGTALEEVVAGARVETNGGTGDAVVLEVDGRYFAQLLRNWAGASEVVIEKGDFVVAGQKPNFKGGAAAGAPLVLRGEPDADGLARMALLMPMRLDTPPSDYAMRLLARCGELVAA